MMTINICLERIDLIVTEIYVFGHLNFGNKRFVNLTIQVRPPSIGAYISYTLKCCPYDSLFGVNVFYRTMVKSLRYGYLDSPILN